MSKKNGKKELKVISQKISSLGICEIQAKGCHSRIEKQIIIKGHPETRRIKVCKNAACSRSGEEQILVKYQKEQNQI